MQIVDEKSFKILLPSGTALAFGKSGLPFVQGEIDGLIELHSVVPGSNYSLIRLTPEQATAVVSQGVRAYPTGDQISMIRLAVQRTDPQQARDVANAIALAYQEQAREAKLKEASTIVELIDQQLVAIGRQLNSSEQNLQEYKIRTGLQRLSPEGSNMVDLAVALEKERADLLLKQQRIASFLDNPGDLNSFDSSAVQTLPGVPELFSRLAELRSIRSELLRQYTASHPDVSRRQRQDRPDTPGGYGCGPACPQQFRCGNRGS